MKITIVVYLIFNAWSKKFHIGSKRNGNNFKKRKRRRWFHKNTKELEGKIFWSVKMVPRQAWGQLLDLLDLPDAHLHRGFVEGVRFSDRSRRPDQVKSPTYLDLVGVWRARLQLVDGVLSHSLSRDVTDDLKDQGVCNFYRAFHRLRPVEKNLRCSKIREVIK